MKLASVARHSGLVLILIFIVASVAGEVINALDRQRDPYLHSTYVVVGPWAYWAPLVVGAALLVLAQLLGRLQR